MLRVNRLTDYAIVLLTWIARNGPDQVHNARDLAGAVGLPLPTVNKVLKALARCGLLGSTRGAKGGYRLARPPQEVSVVEVIRALEGPLAITVCTEGSETNCEHEGTCPVEGSWQRINLAILRALQSITLSEMVAPGRRPAPLVPLQTGGGAGRSG